MDLCWEIDYTNLNEIKPKRELDNFYFLSLKKMYFHKSRLLEEWGTPLH